MDPWIADAGGGDLAKRVVLEAVQGAAAHVHIAQGQGRDAHAAGINAEPRRALLTCEHITGSGHRKEKGNKKISASRVKKHRKTRKFSFETEKIIS